MAFKIWGTVSSKQDFKFLKSGVLRAQVVDFQSLESWFSSGRFDLVIGPLKSLVNVGAIEMELTRLQHVAMPLR